MVLGELLIRPLLKWLLGIEKEAEKRMRPEDFEEYMAMKSVEEVKPNRSFLRELAESAMCSIPAFLAGTLAAQATAGDLFLPDIETLHVALTPTGIKVGDVEVG